MAKMACAQCGGAKKMQVGGRSIPFPIIPPRRYRTSMEEGEDGVWRSKFSDYSEPTKSTKKTANRVKRQAAVNKVKKTVRKIGKALSPNYQDGGVIPKSYSDNFNSKKHVRQLMKADKKMDKADKKWDKKDVKQQAKELMKSKRFQKGGMTGIIGMPKYGNNPRTQEGRVLRNGGLIKADSGMQVKPMIPSSGKADPTKVSKVQKKYAEGGSAGNFAPNRAVMDSCKNGMVRDYTGRCVMERKMAKGGVTKAAKFAALAPPYNKATAADRIAGAKKNARKK